LPTDTLLVLKREPAALDARSLSAATPAIAALVIFAPAFALIRG
jgi:hypothetical protein